MKKKSFLFLLLISASVIFAGCKKEENPVNNNNNGGGSGSVLGKWKILTSNGADISFAGGTYDISESQIVENWTAFQCNKVYSYTKSGNTYTTTLQTSACDYQGGDPSNVPGYTATGTFNVSGNKLTINLQNGTTAVCERIS